MRNSRIEQAYKLRSSGGFLMADTTSGLGVEKQSWSLIPASMLAAPFLGLKRESGRWSETFRSHDYGTFLPARVIAPAHATAGRA
jgi:hypothetical protein